MLDSKRALVIVTGASRGIGREIAIQAASKINEQSTLLLVARNTTGLLETKQTIQTVSKVNVQVVGADLSSTNTQYVNEIANCVDQSVELVAIFHNAGTVGNLSARSDELNSSEDWQNYLQTNLISTILINNAVYSKVRESVIQKLLEFLVVDITSLLAITPFASFTQYSVSKASREAFFRAFALENPETRVLSYSPGPVNTGMRTEVAHGSYSDDIKAAFSDNAASTDASRSVLTTTQTVDRLMGILHDNIFKSGSRIDYFDN